MAADRKKLNKRSMKERRSGEDRRSKTDHPKTVQKAMKLRPRFAELWNRRALSLIKDRQYDGALESLNSAININPRFAEAWYNLAILSCIEGDKQGALSKLQTAIDLEPSLRLRAKSEGHFQKLGLKVLKK
ncbi:MAG: tetratricopeptide repeat protein [Pseudomonadota bacterium]